ncbi:MAG: TonB family protein [Thermodesulfovibrionales bacterium]|nr:TonB family protein [Thermodesulfovibrionales bacterium]
MKEQSYGIMTSISIHTIAIVIFLMLTINKGSNDLKTFYIQFTQMGEHTVQAPPAVREIKKHKVTEPSRKEIKEETPVIKEPPVKEHEAVIRTDAIESPDAVKVASAPEPDPQHRATRQQGGESTVSNVSFSASSGTTSVIETEFGASGAPAFLKRQMPVYPTMAKKLGQQGKVVLRLFINEKGRLLNVQVVEPAGYGFTESAMEAVKMSTFIPAHENGVGIASKALLSIRFVLKRI